MTKKNTRLRRAEAILLLAALGVVIALYWVSSRPVDNVSGQTKDSNSMGPENANTPLLPSPTAAESSQAPTTPLEFLVNRPHRRQSAQQGPLDTPIDFQTPARAAQEPSETAPPGKPNQIDGSRPQNLATEKGPRGVPVTNKMLNGSSEALRNDSPEASKSAP